MRPNKVLGLVLTSMGGGMLLVIIIPWWGFLLAAAMLAVGIFLLTKKC